MPALMSRIAADVRRHRSGFRVRHLLREDASELFTDLRHHVRRRDGNIELHEAALDLVDQILIADDVGTGLLRGFRVVALGKGNDANGASGAVRQEHGSTNALIALLGIDAEPNVRLDRFVELRVGVLLDDRNGFRRREKPLSVETVG